MSDPFDLDDDLPDPFQPAPRAASGPIEVPADAPWLQGLNPEQREAITTTDGPVLVLSGAGTGKTKVLTSRLAHILASRRAQPWQCLAVTFTNKAAREMRERVAHLIGPVAEGCWLGTFHALCVRILRRHAEAVGLKSNFTILDSDDQLRLLKQVMEAEHVDTKKWPAQALMGTIQRWKDRGLLPDKLTAEHASDMAGGRAQELYAQYQQRLITLNACDFGDLLLHNLTLFLSFPEILEQYQGQFRYILVDEYQDTNVAQYLWLRLLAQKHRNICCVGDDDQSSYSRRGAEVGNILRFERDFPGAKVVRLESNYRSTPHILAAASGLIANNSGRLGKTLRPGLEHDRSAIEKVRVRGVWDGPEEARVVVEEIEALQRRGDSLASMAILVRAGFQTREFEERLITTGVPYRVIGGPRFYERQEIRDAMAYLRLVSSPDDGLAFERIVNTPKRGLGDAALQAVHATARATSLSLFEAARLLVETDELKPKPRGSLRDLMTSFERWRTQSESLPHTELAEIVLDESGYTEMWQKDRSADAAGRLENLKELVRSMQDFENLSGFLEHISLVMDRDAAGLDDAVNIMTLHSAKGLEFDTVFLPGWEEGLFPHQRSLDDSGRAGLEEERRLAHVGITRARKRAKLYFATNRRMHGMWNSTIPSRFLDELPEAHVEVTEAKGGFNTMGGYGSGFGASRFDSFKPAGSSYSTPGWQRAQKRQRDTDFEGFGDEGSEYESEGRFSDHDDLSSGDVGRAGAARQGSHSSRGTGTAKGRFAARREPLTIEGELIAKSTGVASAFRTGDRVFHIKFGNGNVVAVDGNKLTIAFDKAGEKRVVDSFVERV